MGSEFIVSGSGPTLNFAPVLGHPLNPEQTKIAYWLDLIASVSITTTAKVKLGGTQVYGTGADYLLPTAARCIVAVRPKVVLTTPTADQFVLATLKVESADLKMGDFEVFANPIAAALAPATPTTAYQYQDAAPWYPLMQPCYGGEKVQFYGTAQVTNTAVTLMSCDVLLSNTWPTGFSSGGWMPGYAPVQAKVAGINYGGGPTATGTTASSVATDAGVTIAAPKKRLISLYGVVLETTPALSKPISGWFAVNASEIAVNPQRWAAEPVTGYLGASPTTGSLSHISTAGPMNLAFNTPSTPKAQFNLDQAITTAGDFEVGYMYIDNP